MTKLSKNKILLPNKDIKNNEYKISTSTSIRKIKTLRRIAVGRRQYKNKLNPFKKFVNGLTFNLIPDNSIYFKEHNSNVDQIIKNSKIWLYQEIGVRNEIHIEINKELMIKHAEFRILNMRSFWIISKYSFLILILPFLAKILNKFIITCKKLK